MITRRTFAATAGAALLGAPRLAHAAQARGLKDHARDHGLLYGCAASTFELNDPAFVRALKTEAAILVPEYEFKRKDMEPERGRLDFSAVDRLLAFAHGNGMAMRGHPLVWYAANPPWLEQAVLEERKEELLTGYIAAVLAHYRGRLHSIDVVNEALLAKSDRKDGLRENFWLKAFGPSYIDTAFHAARAADPDCLLVYNDWGCEAAAPENDRMRAITLDLLEGALARKVPIGAYGMQGHLAAFGPPLDQKKLRGFLESLKALGLRVLITEHDVYDTGDSLDVTIRDRAVADASARFMDVVLDRGMASTVLTWGLSDKFIDPPGWRERLAGYMPRMLPLDSDFQRKPLWASLAASLDRA
ncbi:MAG TPA: endo-1,4-beta-xylanase [Rhizomicrobium sp.]|jgi:endo-1,4-beta-xylanase